MKEKHIVLKALTLASMLLGLMMILFVIIRLFSFDLPIIFIFVMITSFFYYQQCAINRLHYYLIPLTISAALILLPYMIIPFLLICLITYFDIAIYHYSKNYLLFSLLTFFLLIFIEFFDIYYTFLIFGHNSLKEYLTTIKTYLRDFKNSNLEFKQSIEFFSNFCQIILGTLLLLYPTLSCVLILICIKPFLPQKEFNIIKARNTSIGLITSMVILLLISIFYIVFYEKVPIILNYILIMAPIIYIVMSIIISLLIPNLMIKKIDKKLFISLITLLSIAFAIFISLPLLFYINHYIKRLMFNR